MEMGLSRAEFARLLPAAAGPGLGEAEGGWTLEDGPGRVRIRVRALPARNLCRLRLERIEVELAFEGMDPGEVQAFLGRFMASYQRAGG